MYKYITLTLSLPIVRATCISCSQGGRGGGQHEAAGGAVGVPSIPRRAPAV